MKIRQAKKLLLRPWNKTSRYWIEQLSKESGRSCLQPYRDHRLEKANVTLGRYYKKADKLREKKCK